MQITYKYYCLLGGAAHPRCFSRAIYLGEHFMFTAYYMTNL